METLPEAFEVRDDDRSYVLLDDVPETLRPKVERAVQACPRAAIRLED
jgi:ferredoxin